MKRRHRSTPQGPCPFRVGDRIRPIAMFEHHNYEANRSYTVTDIDTNDSTLRATDNNGSVGSWIRWSDCKSACEIGWDWLKGQLSAEALELLSAFDGLERLQLRHDVTVTLVAGLPGLKDRILNCVEQAEITPSQP